MANETTEVVMKRVTLEVTPLAYIGETKMVIREKNKLPEAIPIKTVIDISHLVSLHINQAQPTLLRYGRTERGPIVQIITARYKPQTFYYEKIDLNNEDTDIFEQEGYTFEQIANRLGMMGELLLQYVKMFSKA